MRFYGSGFPIRAGGLPRWFWANGLVWGRSDLFYLDPKNMGKTGFVLPSKTYCPKPLVCRARTRLVCRKPDCSAALKQPNAPRAALGRQTRGHVGACVRPSAHIGWVHGCERAASGLQVGAWMSACGLRLASGCVRRVFGSPGGCVHEWVRAWRGMRSKPGRSPIAPQRARFLRDGNLRKRPLHRSGTPVTPGTHQNM
jgi:hypothetical protein